MLLHVTAAIVGVSLSILTAPPLAAQGPSFSGRLVSDANSPKRVVSGDVNGDGAADIVNSYLGALQCGVRFGNGAGGFGPNAPIAGVNDGEGGLELSDVDGDGDLDIVHSFSKTFLVFPNLVNNNWAELRLNQGNGTFAAALTLNFAQGIQMNGFDIADVDLDGRLDIVASHGALGGGSTLLQTAPLVFTGPFYHALPFSTNAVRARDVNGDGYPDLAAVSLSSASAALIVNSGGAFLGPPALHALGSTRRTCDLEDVDGDGNPDLLAAGGTPCAIDVRLGDGLGGLGSLVSTPLNATSVRDLTCRDFDGDGRIDAAVVVDNLFQNVAVRLGAPGGALGVASDFAAAGLPESLTSADFDTDGVLDLVTSHTTSSALAFWSGDGAGGFGGVPAVQLQDPAVDVKLIDVNRDGDLDIVTREGAGTSVSVRLAVPVGSGQPVQYGAASNYALGAEAPRKLATGDFDNDGTTDLVGIHSYPFYLTATPGTAAGGFGAPVVTPTPTLSPEGLALGDMNGDGFLDAVVTDVKLPDATFNQRRVAVYLGSGAGGFAFSGSTALAGYPSPALDLTDVDHDGDLDALAVRNPTFLAVCLGDGAGGLQAPAEVLGGISANAVRVGDLDRDGDADCVVAGYGVKAWLGDGTGGFTAAGGFPNVAFASAVLADLHGDGKLDLVGSDYSTDRVMVCDGDGLGGLTLPVGFLTGNGPAGVAVGDLDKNGLVDMATASAANNGYNNMVVFHRNRGSLTGVVPFGAGTPGCAGAHALGVRSAPLVGDAGFALTCTNAPPSSLGLALAVNVPDLLGSDPFALGVKLHVDLFLSTEVYPMDMVSYPSGFAVAPAPIPNVPALAGAQYHAQALWLWPATLCVPSLYGLSTTPGLSFAILP